MAILSREKFFKRVETTRALSTKVDPVLIIYAPKELRGTEPSRCIHFGLNIPSEARDTITATKAFDLPLSSHL